MSSKQQPLGRQAAIKELVQKIAISDQKQLVELLQAHYGLVTNQAVVSRDLRKLGVVKKMFNGELVYEMPTVEVTTEILKLALMDISHNESLIVIKTHPGLAAFVGDCLDQHPDLEILGCLAGENVVFVCPKSIQHISQTCEVICEKFHFKKSKEKIPGARVDNF